MLKRVTEVPSDYEFAEEEYFEIEKEEDEEISNEREFKYLNYELVANELFSHHDTVNLRHFEPLWVEQIISMGIIRPTRALFIGIEETYVLKLKNFANFSMPYSWGEANGLDSTKIKLCVCPEKGEVAAGNAQEMEITFTPLTEGIVQSLFVPCFVGDTRKIIMLGIECSIEPLYVTFYFPTDEKESPELRNNFTRIEWRVDSLQIALDMAGKSRKHMKILDKYRMREERELMTTNLDQGLILKDASAGPSTQKLVDVEESVEESSPSIRTSEIIELGNITEENENHSYGNVVAIYEKFLPSPTQPVVIEFLNLSLRTVQKKTFVIKNETSIPTDFSLRIKNCYPIACSCERKSQKDRIKSIYRRIFGRKNKIIEESLHRMKQPESGVVIYVDPINSDIGPLEAMAVDIYVFADTWGIYVDELEINITGLPQYTIGICVQVVGSPILLSISDKNKFNTPVIKYGNEAVGMRLEVRKILLKNTSVIPIAIDWYTFVVKPEFETAPFNVIFNLCTPFTDEFASKLRADKQKTDSEMHLEKHAKRSMSKRLHSCDSIDVSDFTTVSSYMESPFISKSWRTYSESFTSTETSFRSSDENFSKILKSDKSEQNTEEQKDIDLKISVIPYCGSVDTKICTVTPKETFILPGGNASLDISMHPEHYKAMITGIEPIEGELLCKILGFLRIAPRDTYKDNYYAREAGIYLSPIEIDVTANIVRPSVDFDLSKDDRTFTCCASDVMLRPNKRLELTKTFFFYNNDSKVIEIFLETYVPFHVKSVSLYTEKNPCKSGTICINPYGCAEVKIGCTIDAELIEILMNTNSDDLLDSMVTARQLLQIVHSDRRDQVSIVPLLLFN